jgi:DNA-binding transcriptional ArsR family regulator
MSRAAERPEDAADFPGAVAALRALGASDRLRLVALCSPRPIRVSDLAACLDDSEPNVSRALKQLAAAGVLKRERQGHAVRYGLADPQALAGRLARAALAAIGDADPLLKRAATRLARLSDQDEHAQRRLGRALRAELIAQLSPSTTAHAPASALPARHVELGRVLVAGAVPSEVVGWALDQASQVVRLGKSRIAAGSIDLCIWGLEAGASDGPAQVDQCARRASEWLQREGRLCIHAPYDALEGAGPPPPARLREVMARRGWRCDRIRPVEAGVHHVLIAHARRELAA